MGLIPLKQDRNAKRQMAVVGLVVKKRLSAIAKLIIGKLVSCIGSDRDEYDRLIATYSVGKIEIIREMVRLGLAWNFDKYSMDYKSLENEIRKSHLGVFQAPTITPWEYRQQGKNLSCSLVALV